MVVNLLSISQCAVFPECARPPKPRLASSNRRPGHNNLALWKVAIDLCIALVHQLDFDARKRRSEVRVPGGIIPAVVKNIRLADSACHARGGQSVAYTCPREDAQVGEHGAGKCRSVLATALGSQDQAEGAGLVAHSCRRWSEELEEQVVCRHAASRHGLRLGILAELLRGVGDAGGCFLVDSRHCLRGGDDDRWRDGAAGEVEVDAWTGDGVDGEVGMGEEGCEGVAQDVGVGEAVSYKNEV